MNDNLRLGLDFIGNVVAGTVKYNLDAEAVRGCLPELFPMPVRLEPAHYPFNASQSFADSDKDLAVPIEKIPKIYFSQILFPLNEVDWIKLENAIVGFSGFNEIFSFEIVGNNKGVSVYLGFQKKGLLAPVQSILRKINSDIDLIACKDPLAGFEAAKLSVFELCMEAPYYHQLFNYKNRASSPLNSLMHVFSAISEDALGVYQVLFCHTKEPWERNIKNALEAESLIKSANSFGKTTSRELKDYTGKPLFAVRPRFFCTSANSLIED